MTLPPIPKDHDWSEATWRAGLDEAVRLCGSIEIGDWDKFAQYYSSPNTLLSRSIIAHATTLLDAGIVKPVVSEAEAVWREANAAWEGQLSAYIGKDAAIAVIQSALDKARAGQ